jgi:2-(1,2-epoxy-1,2-dihydrophenyl)acetyl-CoA isomerase
MNAAPVLFDLRDGIAWTTLNRPEAGNAVNLAMARALMEVAIRSQTDRSRCVVLTGAGRIFCAGGDVVDFAGAGDQVNALLSDMAGTLHMALARFARMAKPLLDQLPAPALAWRSAAMSCFARDRPTSPLRMGRSA